MSLWLETPDFQLLGAQEFSEIRAVSATSGAKTLLPALGVPQRPTVGHISLPAESLGVDTVGAMAGRTREADFLQAERRLAHPVLAWHLTPERPGAGLRDGRHRSVGAAVLERAMLDVEDAAPSRIDRWADDGIPDRNDTL